ncbi:HAMP domain-containing sensor histidine kinase [Desulforapulum autotrophicum]|nr:HAMP domain-containing sensor histidine kinase [Desulforapulum autotrophicum]
MKLGISRKLILFFSLFILIFYGTVVDMFIRVQDMSKISSRIVTINNQIAELSKNLQDSLMDMEVNDKKFRLLKNPLYFDYFETARKAYLRDLDQIIHLESHPWGFLKDWKKIQQKYGEFTGFRPPKSLMDLPSQWEQEDLIIQWMDLISKAREANDLKIKQGLIQINRQTRQVVRNGVIGFGISMVVGLFGILFISKSMLTPLNKLKQGLTQISTDNYAHEVVVSSRDEFGELADAFNAMSHQLKADEDIRSDFIATLSHEIRTPLSSVQESVNMIIEEILGPVNERQKKFLKLAGSEITRITSLLNHLLDISMLEAGTQKSNPAPFDPNQLIVEAIQSLDTTAKRKHTVVKAHTLIRAPRVMGEEKEIMQVLMNIIGNAIKFSDENSLVDIWLSKSREDGFLSFNISDNGPGIPREKHGLIFKRYYRAEEVRNHMSGVGLGLNISRRIVQSHGGKIFVENNIDKGCTFTFTLPVEKSISV